MTDLRQALDDYLTMRRALGYKLDRAEKDLKQFITYLEGLGEDHVTTQSALAWATLPSGAHRGYLSARLSSVRRFAIHLRAIDPATQVPPTDLLPGRNPRATPYLYTRDEVTALMRATATLHGPYRQATYRTLIGLLAVTGLRIGEAIGIDCKDLDAREGLLAIRNGKCGKSRELPLHPSTVTALCNYLRDSDRSRQPLSTPALFISAIGTRLARGSAENVFRQLISCAGLSPRSAACRPRLHDFRHAFAVNTILDGYSGGGDPGARIALLSTYLGHVNPAMTYWYLSAAPELLALAKDRLERCVGGEA